jgi:4-hydroxybenzoate polyprenyltransferase
VRERFPIHLLFLFCFLSVRSISVGLVRSPELVVLTILYLLFFLYLRILDEFKDFRYDETNHKDRPLQRGLVTKKDLVSLLFVTIFSMAGCVIYLGGYWAFTIIVFLYSLCMYREFYCHDWLKKHMVIYLVSHQIVFVPLWMYFFSVVTKEYRFIFNPAHISLLLYMILPVVIMEIGRKMVHRHSHTGKKTNDTYAYIWGEKGAVLLFSTLFFVGGLISWNTGLIRTSGILLIFSFGFICLCMQYFNVRFIVKNYLLCTFVGTVLLPCILLLFRYA